MPEGFFALEADRLLREGKNPTEIVAYLEKLKERCNIIFGLSTIKSLVGSGTMARLETLAPYSIVSGVCRNAIVSLHSPCDKNRLLYRFINSITAFIIY